MGDWEPVTARFKHLPVHVALLHTGKVLAIGGSGNDPTNEGHPWPPELFDPRTGDVRQVAGDVAGDMFCGGHAFLPDGRLLVAGGTRLYDGPTFPPFRGLGQAYLFDPESERFSRGPDMRNGRWYPTLVSLGDGRVLAVAGLTAHFPWAFLREIETYTVGGGWAALRNASRWMPLYPRLHLLPDGTVFYAGSYNTHLTFPFVLWAFPTSILDPSTGRWRVIGPPHQSEREEGASVLLPLEPPDYRARTALLGGGTPGGTTATNSMETIDLWQPRPRWDSRPSMVYPRYYCYAVTLPDGQLLILGGRNGKMAMGHETMPSSSMMSPSDEIAHDPLAILTPELLDLDTWTWQSLAPMQVDRMYHSNAVLLPDGRVMMAGSNPARGVNELRIEIFRPPYLFRGPRPVIETAPRRIVLGSVFDVETPDADEVDRVVLIHPSATTHCVDTEQRLVQLEVARRSPGTLVVGAPTNVFAAPPGFYLLFLVRRGVPSEGRFVRVTTPGGDD